MPFLGDLYFLHSICSISKRRNLANYKAKADMSLLPDAEKKIG